MSIFTFAASQANWIAYAILLIIVLISGFVPIAITKIHKANQARRHRAKNASDISPVLRDVSLAIEEVKRYKKGALIIIERGSRVDKQIIDGENIDALVSKSLLTNIFEGEKTPLHDGAVVIRGNRIAYAGSFIVTLTNKKLSRQYGTRHRSAIGLSEKSDAIIIVLSEESGDVTVCIEGRVLSIESHLLYDELSKILETDKFVKAEMNENIDKGASSASKGKK